jgi:(5-formylfuran-3-yl)methyl phosphate synthase
LAGLLVSVRSADEAEAALAGGAKVIDVKEPDHGPLGCAEPRVWRDVRRVVPAGIPVSVALGELRDWRGGERHPAGPDPFAGLAYRKLGLAGAGGGPWEVGWANLRSAWGAGPAWIAVAYADWTRARSPEPDAVLDAALRADDCAGILIDTWDKSAPSTIAADSTWQRWFARARQRRRPFVITLAGGLDVASIARLAPLRPDYFGVRGAACATGDRRGTIDRGRVARLARVVEADASDPPRYFTGTS